MSHSDDFYDDDEMSDELRAQLDAEMNMFRERIEAAEPELAKIGLYLQTTLPQPVHTPFGTRPGMVLISKVGDVAFTPRVQDPEQHGMNQQFSEMEASLTADQFLDNREKIKRNIAAGRDPFDDGPDEAVVEPEAEA